jgi:signal peptide peptidase SppA
MTRGAHVLSFAVDHPWAITRPMGPIVAGILARWAAGKDTDPQTIAAALVNRKNLPQPSGEGAIAIIPIYGVIAPRANLITDFSGGTTFETLSKQLAEAMANKAIKTIVFDVDSPGGNVAGATEFAREVMRARTKKPIIAVAQYMMASAAYWGVAGATEIVAAPSAMVGSIGVFTIHEDLSKALEMEGVKLTYIAAGKYKVDGNETEPLSKETLARIAAKVNEAYEKFLSDVSKGRGVPLEDVRAGYGEGDTVSAAEALRLKMVDKVATLDETLARVMTPPDQRAAATPQPQHATTHDPKDTKPTVDTPQEPAKATGQDRPSDADWQNGINAGLLQLDM